MIVQNSGFYVKSKLNLMLPDWDYKLPRTERPRPACRQGRYGSLSLHKRARIHTNPWKYVFSRIHPRPNIPACPSYALHCRSEEHTSELQSQFHLVCRLLLEK